MRCVGVSNDKLSNGTVPIDNNNNTNVDLPNRADVTSLGLTSLLKLSAEDISYLTTQSLSRSSFEHTPTFHTEPFDTRSSVMLAIGALFYCLELGLLVYCCWYSKCCQKKQRVHIAVVERMPPVDNNSTLANLNA